MKQMADNWWGPGRYHGPFDMDDSETRHFVEVTLTKIHEAKKQGFPYACISCGAGLREEESCACREEEGTNG